uniref:Uncharacterized protein n=1 Tax=Salix viminalis TaxID=40686 RepID=A0A6N2KE84_SALVM
MSACLSTVYLGWRVLGSSSMFKVSGTCLPCLPLAELYFKLLLDIQTSKPVVYLDANFMYNKHRLGKFRRLQTYRELPPRVMGVTVHAIGITLHMLYMILCLENLQSVNEAR